MKTIGERGWKRGEGERRLPQLVLRCSFPFQPTDGGDGDQLLSLSPLEARPLACRCREIQTRVTKVNVVSTQGRLSLFLLPFSPLSSTSPVARVRSGNSFIKKGG